MIDKHLNLIAMTAFVLLVSMAFLSGCTSVEQPVTSPEMTTRTMTDMAGRTIDVPQNIDHVLSTAPPSTMDIYMLAPDKLLGVNFVANRQNGKVYVPEKYLALPDVGGWYGKNTGNYETFIGMDPDVVINCDTGVGDFAATLEERQEKFGIIPVIGVTDARNVTQYDESIRFLGTLLGAEAEADTLMEFYHRVLSPVTSRVREIPADQRVRVYYAEGPEGLLTDPSGSTHSELIELAGGVNVADCAVTPGMGQTPVSMEQVTKWNPEVIIAGDPAFFASVYTDTLWQDIPAVKDHRVYLVPQSPFPWFDRPPGVNRIIGIPWTAKVLYPDMFADLDMPALTREFYSKFYHYELTDSDIENLLDPSLR